jgi:large subunit ribosomal protein L2
MSFIKGEGVDYKTKPLKSLTKTLKKRGGRMRSGKISAWQRGGGQRRRYRLINFKGAEGSFKVERLEKDPNRSAFIALVSDEKEKRHYMLAENSLRSGDSFKIGKEAEIKEGNRTTLSRIPTGTLVSNIELYPGAGGKIARSAGSSAVMMGLEGGLAQLKMPSGEVRQVKENCFANIGPMSNPENSAMRIGKAGRKRLMGWRPNVRGKAMNPVDHPHGGGEGNQPIGLKHPKTPWGKPALGVKTRNPRKLSSKYIVSRRKRKR